MTLEPEAQISQTGPEPAYKEYLKTQEDKKEETQMNTNYSTAENSQEDSLLSLRSEGCELACGMNKYFMSLRPLRPQIPSSKASSQNLKPVCFNSNLNTTANGINERKSGFIASEDGNRLCSCNNVQGANLPFGDCERNKRNLSNNYNCVCSEINNSNDFNRNSAYPTSTKQSLNSNLNLNLNSNNINNSNTNLISLKSSNTKQLLNNFPDKLFKKTIIPLQIFQDLYESLILEERSHIPCFGYMQSQTDINEKMRAVLIDWLSEVHLKFNLFPETIFLTVNIIDRYLSKKTILKNHLQLCGVAALLIACKYEEIYCPDLSDLVYITDKAYSKDEIIFMEKEILKTLNYEITVPTAVKFYDLLAVNFAFDETEFHLGRYFLEIFLMDYRVNKYQASLVACAVVYLVLKISKYEDYRLINCYTLDAEKDLKNCAKEICFLVENIDSTNLLSIKTKYAAKEFHEVSKINFK